MLCCRNYYFLYILDKKVERCKFKFFLFYVLNFEIIWNFYNNYEIVGLIFLYSRYWVKFIIRFRDEFSRENKL